MLHADREPMQIQRSFSSSIGPFAANVLHAAVAGRSTTFAVLTSSEVWSRTARLLPKRFDNHALCFSCRPRYFALKLLSGFISVLRLAVGRTAVLTGLWFSFARCVRHMCLSQIGHSQLLISGPDSLCCRISRSSTHGLA